jgi:hypothetical protein
MTDVSAGEKSDSSSRPLLPNTLNPSAEAERALVEIFLGMRAYHLASAAVSVWLDRPRYRRPTLAAALLALVGAESVWLVWRHHLRRQPFDRRTMRVDVAVGATAFAACSVAVRADEQFTAVNWAFPMNLWTAVAATCGFPRRGALRATAVLIGVYGIATARRSGGFRSESLFGMLQYAGGWLGGDLVIRRLRRAAVQIAQLDAAAVEQAAQIAEEEIRAALHQDLHRRAVDTLEVVRDQLFTDPAGTRALARQEADRLRRALRGEQSGGLAAVLQAAVVEAGRRGLVVDLIASGLDGHDELGALVSEAVATAVRALLASCEPGQGGETVVLRATAGADQNGPLEVSLRHRGLCDAGLDVAELADLLRQVSGSLALHHPAGGGLRAVITVGKPPESDDTDDEA